MPERDLARLLANARPVLQPGEYVFVTVQIPPRIPEAAVLMRFREREGTTLIITRATADQFGLSYDLVVGWIVMTVNSALDAVGFTAAFATALAEAGISCNVVAGFYHDHLFVPLADATRAVATLNGLAKK